MKRETFPIIHFIRYSFLHENFMSDDYEAGMIYVPIPIYTYVYYIMIAKWPKAKESFTAWPVFMRVWCLRCALKHLFTLGDWVILLLFVFSNVIQMEMVGSFRRIISRPKAILFFFAPATTLGNKAEQLNRKHLKRNPFVKVKRNTDRPLYTWLEEINHFMILFFFLLLH